jgi:VanZ family protein
MSSHPSPETIKAFPIIAKLKVVHLIEYGLLYYFFWWAITKTTTYDQTESFVLALALTVLYGLTDEFHQIFVVCRTASLVDVVADGAGACLTSLAIKLNNIIKIRSN